ncbi:MAG: hypothetical protein AMS21_12415 [Gemmatimonas sp. SG8_38_2]|nr:MAG: hypothetical protein AMS21_12415 [Gemmatimonas sp. SG8_38_2]
MRTSLLTVLFLAVLAAGASAQEPDLRPMTTDDGLNMVRVSNPLLSPDGRWVLYQQSQLDWKENKRKNVYYMAPAGGGEAFQYIGEAGGSDPQFSPDGKYLSFKREAEKKQQLFLMRTGGGEAVQLTEQKTSIGDHKWASDSRSIFFVADEPKSEEEEKRHKDGYDAIIVDEGPNGQQAGSWSNIWVIGIEDKEEQKLTDDEHLIGDFDVAPDGRRILFTARTENRRNQRNLSEIFLLDISDSTKTRLTDNRSPENEVLWGPDGSQFLFLAPGNSDWDLRQGKIWILNLETGDVRSVSDAFEGRISDPVWTPDGHTILFTGRHRTNSNVFSVDARSGTLEQLTDVIGSVSVGSYSTDRSVMAYTFQDFDTPPDIFTSPTRQVEPTRITHANPWVDSTLALARAEVVQWESSDGLEIEGILVLPADYERGTRMPLLLHVHGGPAGAFTNIFRYSYHVWAGLGYAQLLPNVRGSSGYSDEFLRGNMNDIGGGDYQDLMTGVDYVIEQGYVEPDTLGIRGWSYGGILGGWTITQTNRFRGASLGAMVSDWTSEYGPGFNHDVRLWYIGGTPWENPEAFRQMSALTHVANVYIKFPREPHGFREPRHQRTRDIEEIKWIQKYVRGIDWTPWEREDDAEKKEEIEEEKDTSPDRVGTSRKH